MIKLMVLYNHNCWESIKEIIRTITINNINIKHDDDDDNDDGDEHQLRSIRR